ncbi:MAG: hypothetical protein PWP46_1905 [Fusobacteriaceae bacterium]|nr:hypothetical protein [Fusobacteriaceae bacterium]
MNKKLAIGIDDFKKIISEDYYLEKLLIYQC